MKRFLLLFSIAVGSFALASNVLAACPSPGKCVTQNVCIANSGATLPGSSCTNAGEVCCDYKQATACSGVTVSTPCPTNANITEVPDGANAVCPTNYVNRGCSSSPKSGSGVVLCCENPIGGTGSQCGPQAGVQGFEYLCLRPEGCSQAKGEVIKDIKSPDISCSQSEEVCCRTKARTGQTVTSPTTKAGTTKGSSFNLANPLGTTSIPVIIGRIIAMFLGIVGAIALLVFVYGGVAWMTARGDVGQVKNAQAAIKGAILGLIIISGSYLFADSFIKALTTQIQVTGTGTTGGSAQESTQATQEQTTLEQQQAQAEAAAKAKAQGGGAVCVGDATAAKACREESDCSAFCSSQWQAAGLPPQSEHPCTVLGPSGCPTDKVCCSWKK